MVYFSKCYGGHGAHAAIGSFNYNRKEAEVFRKKEEAKKEKERENKLANEKKKKFANEKDKSRKTSFNSSQLFGGGLENFGKV